MGQGQTALQKVAGQDCVPARLKSYPLRKSQDLKAKLIVEFKDDHVLYEQLLNMLVMALEIAGKDEKDARAYQEKILENL